MRGGGGACVVGGMHGRGVYVVGACMTWSVHGGGMHDMGCAWLGGVHGRGGMCGMHAPPQQILRDTVNERAVGILLECILVLDKDMRTRRCIHLHAPNTSTQTVIK